MRMGWRNILLVTWQWSLLQSILEGHSDFMQGGNLMCDGALSKDLTSVGKVHGLLVLVEEKIFL